MSLTIALVGNPGVGKSLIFNQLTGVGVETGNYPGSSIDLLSGGSCFQRERVEVLDLPGVYSLEDGTETDALVRRVIDDDTVTAIVAESGTLPASAVLSSPATEAAEPGSTKMPSSRERNL